MGGKNIDLWLYSHGSNQVRILPQALIILSRNWPIFCKIEWNSKAVFDKLIFGSGEWKSGDQGSGNWVIGTEKRYSIIRYSITGDRNQVTR